VGVGDLGGRGREGKAAVDARRRAVHDPARHQKPLRPNPSRTRTQTREAIEAGVNEALMSGRREGAGRAAAGSAGALSFADDLESSGDDLFGEGGGLEDLEAKIERQAQLAGSGAA
jgi:hypothetical protein